MKKALKCLFGLIDFGLKRSAFVKVPLLGGHTLSLTLCQSVRECPKFLIIWQTTKFEVGFQKSDKERRFLEKFERLEG